ncbi:KH domain-containing protein [Leptolyngbya sp. FACHB-711]|uniref:KH domain-containing protein n=1 Tax=Leptolyngbya sp. FACHB-711 TaxID=2692813 RepID=UPI001681E31B|nr:KH domain-containing protein [Leptolyngbya sp. FACHB-711]MBD2027700.1 KH domain-containing protein [Leptolyngbya sp. FACHB-711]
MSPKAHPTIKISVRISAGILIKPVSQTSSNYSELVRFLVQPFLDSPESLRLDCEVSPRTSRVLIRLAIEGEDKGRVFGRGGRNIQAIRTVVQALAQAAGQVVHLEVFGGMSGQPAGHDDRREGSRNGGNDNRPPRSQPSRRPRR